MEFDVFALASLIGTLAFAFSGFLAGVRKQLDMMGIFIVTMLTANGGGAVRDVLVGRTPAVLTDPSGFYQVLAVFLFGWLMALHKYEHVERHTLFVVSDAIGLAAFSVTGALVGIEYDLHIFGVMVLAFLTATGGGIIRDILVNEVPSVLSSDFYGTVALMLAIGLYALHHFGYMNDVNVLILFLAALALRLLAWRKGWHLPHMKLKND